jgi:hypothetical protein
VLPGGVDVPALEIKYAKFGTRDGYCKKIYGKDFDPSLTSWDRFPEGVRRGWPLHKIYEMLHDRVEIQVVDVDRSVMLELLREYDLVFNSAPAALFVERDGQPVEIKTERVWIKSEPDPSMASEPWTIGLIVYEGEPAIPHYRYSWLEGVSSWEYPEKHGDPGDGILVSKPLSISAPPMHPRIVPIGRYGQWKKGVLVDSVFGEVSDVIGRLDD